MKNKRRHINSHINSRHRHKHGQEAARTNPVVDTPSPDPSYARFEAGYRYHNFRRQLLVTVQTIRDGKCRSHLGAGG